MQTPRLGPRTQPRGASPLSLMFRHWLRGRAPGIQSRLLLQWASSILGTVRGPETGAPLAASKGGPLEVGAREETPWTVGPEAPPRPSLLEVGFRPVLRTQNLIPMLGSAGTGLAGAGGGAHGGAQIPRTPHGCPSWHQCWVH